MSSTDSVLIDLFSKFIAKCFNIRDKNITVFSYITIICYLLYISLYPLNVVTTLKLVVIYNNFFLYTLSNTCN